MSQAMQHATTAYARGRWVDAEALCRKILAARRDYFEALTLLGIIAARTRRTEEAAELLRRAVAAQPGNAAAHSNYGNVLQALRRFDEALSSYERALKLKPDYAEAHYNRGNALLQLQRFEEALYSYGQALKIKPDFAEAYNNRGTTLQRLKRFEEALDNYADALKSTPDGRWLVGMWLLMKMCLCDWSDLDTLIPDLITKIRQAKKVTTPFAVLSVVDDPALQLQVAEIWINQMYPPSRALPPLSTRCRHERIRIGYYSADYHTHATTHLMAGLFETHDRRRFELLAFSYGPDQRDALRKRLAGAFDRFLEVRTKSDIDIARISRELEIDIAVDLKGFTQDARTGIFCYRAAPIQVSYLGYPGTSGASYIDYLIADQTLIPKESRPHYSEKIVYLPHSYQANDQKRLISDRVFARTELGLPSTGFVFCCFNNNYKIAPHTFDSWMRILRQVEGSVLWLLEDNGTAAHNLRREAQARDVDAERLIFAQRMPLPEHLARHRAADLFIDTLPCNAHTTASDALWAGLPVLTGIGESFAARVSASLLNAVGLPELISTTPEQYEAKAVELASDPDQLAQLREKLHRNRLTMPLFDTEQFAAHLEDAYRQMYERYLGNLTPDHIYIA